MTIVYIGAAVGATIALLSIAGDRIHARQLEREREQARASARVVEIKNYPPATRDQIKRATGPRR